MKQYDHHCNTISSALVQQGTNCILGNYRYGLAVIVGIITIHEIHQICHRLLMLLKKQPIFASSFTFHDIYVASPQLNRPIWIWAFLGHLGRLCRSSVRCLNCTPTTQAILGCKLCSNNLPVVRIHEVYNKGLECRGMRLTSWKGLDDDGTGPHWVSTSSCRGWRKGLQRAWPSCIGLERPSEIVDMVSKRSGHVFWVWWVWLENAPARAVAQKVRTSWFGPVFIVKESWGMCRILKNLTSVGTLHREALMKRGFVGQGVFFWICLCDVMTLLRSAPHRTCSARANLNLS